MKYFTHPDLNQFKKEELDGRFARIVTEKPKESRKGTFLLPCGAGLHLHFQNRVKLIGSALDSKDSTLDCIHHSDACPSSSSPLYGRIINGGALPLELSSPTMNGRVLKLEDERRRHTSTKRLTRATCSVGPRGLAAGQRSGSAQTGTS
jgi:hypothetical protein